VPPKGLAVRVTLWPLSMTGPEGDIAPAVRALLTVTPAGEAEEEDPETLS
jgi:hypothetical protein